MSLFQKFDSWISSIGKKTIKPVASVAVYATSSLFGAPSLGKTINSAWMTQEELSERQNASNLYTAASSESNSVGLSNSWYFIGFLILLYFAFKKKKR